MKHGYEEPLVPFLIPEQVFLVLDLDMQSILLAGLAYTMVKVQVIFILDQLHIPGVTGIMLRFLDQAQL